jgi:hypothetical protein
LRASAGVLHPRVLRGRLLRAAATAATTPPSPTTWPSSCRAAAGQCWDSALAESFFAALKGECLDQQPWPTRAAARRATVEYIAWYNGTRLHSALGYMTPDEFETATDQEAIKQVA